MIDINTTLDAHEEPSSHNDDTLFKNRDHPPASSGIDLARQQAEGLVRNTASQVNLLVQHRIDELINLQANIDRTARALMHYIGEFCDRGNEAVATCNTIRKEIEEMASPFSKSPPATITQLEEEGGSK